MVQETESGGEEAAGEDPVASALHAVVGVARVSWRKWAGRGGWALRTRNKLNVMRGLELRRFTLVHVFSFHLQAAVHGVESLADKAYHGGFALVGLHRERQRRPACLHPPCAHLETGLGRWGTRQLCPA